MPVGLCLNCRVNHAFLLAILLILQFSALWPHIQYIYAIYYAISYNFNISLLSFLKEYMRFLPALHSLFILTRAVLQFTQLLRFLTGDSILFFPLSYVVEVDLRAAVVQIQIHFTISKSFTFYFRQFVHTTAEIVISHDIMLKINSFLPKRQTAFYVHCVCCIVQVSEPVRGPRFARGLLSHSLIWDTIQPNQVGLNQSINYLFLDMF